MSRRGDVDLGADADMGTLAVAAAEIPGTYLLPELLASFRDDHPGVEMEFRVAGLAEVLELVRAHRVELAVVAGASIPSELDSESLSEDEIVLIGPPALGGRRLRPSDLASRTWIVTDESSPTQEAVDAARWQLGCVECRR